MGTIDRIRRERGTVIDTMTTESIQHVMRTDYHVKSGTYKLDITVYDKLPADTELYYLDSIKYFNHEKRSTVTISLSNFLKYLPLYFEFKDKAEDFAELIGRNFAGKIIVNSKNIPRIVSRNIAVLNSFEDTKVESKKIFISHPMSGLTLKEIKETREYMKDEVIKIMGPNVEFFDNIQEDLPEGTHSLVYLGNDIKMLSKADAAFFYENWKDYRGCKVEHLVCEEYNIPISIIALKDKQ